MREYYFSCTDMGEVKVYYDGVSQPCRAVLLLLKANNVPYEPVKISLFKSENTTNEEFLKVNPLKSIPAIDNNGFCVCESSAILQYIVEKFNLPDHWYPKDLKARTKVNEYLFWHHCHLRRGASGTFVNKHLFPKFGRPVNEERLKEVEEMLNTCLERLETQFLKEGKFIGGSDSISIADLQALCELTQFWMAKVIVYKDKPRITQWVAECQKVLASCFDEVYEDVYEKRDSGFFD